MNKRVSWVAALVTVLTLLAAGSAGLAQDARAGEEKDVFKGKLFPPNVILEHQDGLGLTKEQFTAIRGAVVQVQADVAEHEWDLRMAYQAVLTELDNSSIDSDRVLALVTEALRAENEVKKLQVGLLLELRSMLTDEQMDYLRQVTGH